MRLNLGCSTDIRPGWLNVDIVPRALLDLHDADYQQADLNAPWPWPDSSIEEIYAADIFEHLENRIHTLNEVWRILKPGGILRMECPDAAKGAGQWQDPTHVTPWTPNGLQYFTDGSPAWKRFHEAYGITARFRVIDVHERMYPEWAGPGADRSHSVLCEVWKFTAVLEAVK